MLKIENGEAVIKSIPVTLRPQFTLRELRSLKIALVPQIINDPFRSYALGKRIIGDRIFHVVLYFYKEKLESIHLADSSEEFGASWDEWSEEKELKRKEAHDRWLIAETGNASHVYRWGEIISPYDPRSGGSSITIRYSWQGEP